MSIVVSVWIMSAFVLECGFCLASHAVACLKEKSTFVSEHWVSFYMFVDLVGDFVSVYQMF